MLFSVIVPTCHRNDLLAQCLQRLAPKVQTLSADSYEVIVTDDGTRSNAETLLRTEFPWARWTKGPGQGPAANRNNGARLARGEWLAFTDDDCLPEPGWLNAFADATQGDAGALEGAIHPLGDLNQDLVECPVNLTGNCFWSANIAVQRSLFEEVGAFDASYPAAAHEDQDLKLRLSQHTAIPFIANAIVHHPIRHVSFVAALSRMPRQCANYSVHVFKHRKSKEFSTLKTLFFRQLRFQIAFARACLRENKPLSGFLSLLSLVLLPYLCYRVFWSLPRQQFLSNPSSSFK